MKKQLSYLIVAYFLLGISIVTNAQTVHKEMRIKHKKKKSTYLNFEIAHNLMIIPVRINDSDTLKFILDTGVTHTLLTDLNANDALTLQYSRKIDLFGLGQGDPVEALHSYGNEISLPGVYGNFHDLIVPLENIFYLSESLGKQVNGLLGYEVFNSFIVEIDYNKQKLALHDPNRYRAKLEKRKKKWLKKEKAVVLPLDIVRRKPYLNASITDTKGKKIDLKLLVDSGASHAVSLYTGTKSALEIPNPSFRSFLGTGLNGDIYGYTGRVSQISLGDFSMPKPLVSFPDKNAVRGALNVGNRNGSLGSDVLRRFDIIIDYTGNQMILRPNQEYKTEFLYNLSGVEIVTPFPGMPIFQVAEVRENSPGQEAGLIPGDQIMAINGINIARFSMSEIIKLFSNKPGKKFRVYIHRDGEYFRTEFTLRDDLSPTQNAESRNTK